MFAVQTFLLACSAAGLDAYPMEGFDEARVQEVLGVDANRFGVPVVVSVAWAGADDGVSDSFDDSDDSDPSDHSTMRFPPEDVFHIDSYGNFPTEEQAKLFRI